MPAACEITFSSGNPLQGLEGLFFGNGLDLLKVCSCALQLMLSIICQVTLILPEPLCSGADAVWWLDRSCFLCNQNEIFLFLNKKLNTYDWWSFRVTCEELKASLEFVIHQKTVTFIASMESLYKLQQGLLISESVQVMGASAATSYGWQRVAGLFLWPSSKREK